MKIALLDDYQGVALDCADWSSLQTKAEVVVFRDTITDRDALVERLKDFEVIGIMRERTPFPAALLERLPKLKLLVTTGHRNAAVDVAAAKARGITVCGTPSSANAAAELTWALIMAAARRLDAESRSFREGGWQRSLGRGLSGKTLGVVGLGRLGSLVARYGQAFEMKVIAWSQNLTAERAAECGAELVDKQRLFRESDFVSLHLRLSDRTRDLVAAGELALMKPDAWLVNTARGPMVNAQDLLAALKEGRIGGAALDVFDVEPLPADDELRRLDNVVATPHIGYVTQENYRSMYSTMVANIEAYLDGKPQNVIEP